ncbi:glycosyltransferase family 2 protein [Hymenobacter baengnokdamensis]|uniref:glycosyltransferase family 2 protein n=1 Tax=Hymenobacter baengnokdamensis TaxID=2615203 RepID=UPI0012489F64|nr:hypothetical protein [Hymenobacter baengnokdamensis]
MIDIFIKSCNRAYYLDRCLQSIYKLVTGEFTIKILDDGTPPQYLARIAQQYPDVQMLRSPLYGAKVAILAGYLQQGQAYQSLGIPTQFWIESIAAGTDYFLLLEDDIWLTQPVDVSAIEATIRRERLAMVRLSWQGNPQLVAGQLHKLDASIEEIKPTIPQWRSLVFTNRFKVRSVGYKLGFFRDIMPYQLPLYVLYAVAAAFFEKHYWLFLWQGAGTRVLEEAQLKKALYWYQQQQSRYAKVLVESAQTSYLTSTTNGYQETRCDMLLINHLLNEAWLGGELDSMQQYPKDFAVAYLAPFLLATPNGQELYHDWLTWTARFKNDYERVGCVVE